MSVYFTLYRAGSNDVNNNHKTIKIRLCVLAKTKRKHTNEKKNKCAESIARHWLKMSEGEKKRDHEIIVHCLNDK